MTIRQLVLWMIVSAVVGLCLIFGALALSEKGIIGSDLIYIVSIIVAPVFIAGFIVGIIADRTLRNTGVQEKPKTDIAKGGENGYKND